MTFSEKTDFYDKPDGKNVELLFILFPAFGHRGFRCRRTILFNRRQPFEIFPCRLIVGFYEQRFLEIKSGLIEFTDIYQSRGKIVIYLVGLRIESQGRPVMDNRLFRFAEFDQKIGKIVMNRRVIRFYLQSPPVMGDGFFRLAGGGVKITQVALGNRVFRIQLRGLVKMVKGFIRPAIVYQQFAQARMGFTAAGENRNGMLIKTEGVFPVPGLVTGYHAQ